MNACDVMLKCPCKKINETGLNKPAESQEENTKAAERSKEHVSTDKFIHSGDKHHELYCYMKCDVAYFFLCFLIL